MVELLTCNEVVVGSIPIASSIKNISLQSGNKSLKRSVFQAFSMEGFPSGQREQTVNLSAQPSEVRILPPPPRLFSFAKREIYGRE
jgi:hypothetical protein